MRQTELGEQVSPEKRKDHCAASRYRKRSRKSPRKYSGTSTKATELNPNKKARSNMTLAQVQHLMEIDEEEIWNTNHEPKEDHDTELDAMLNRAITKLHKEMAVSYTHLR